ncbi:MAG: hypothetical protein E5Y10_33600 [Mesorhizobium sp.]|uniref:hypothetical protein n=1 Tax=Mesorhizobium sp. TaxID=1871066 RepID=UPI0011FCAF03|nr:hypothetical protein [Mesorhizobium sp.]TIN40433.1 MAG: hypothetical protein E5Y13_11655 [Mesorhizobium sp.]TJU83819.1 MAG: hypothetical protein E5Y10_33600 [Mesorhizobium sp.]
MPTPDQRSYYGYHRTFGIYFEVIDYGRLLADAKRRNRVFFDRLNRMDAQLPLEFDRKGSCRGSTCAVSPTVAFCREDGGI